MLAAIITSIANTAEVLIDKHALSDDHIPYKMYVPLAMHLIFLVMLLAAPFMFHYSPAFFTMKNLLLMAAVIVIAILANYFYYYGFEKEKVSEAEPFILMQPLFSILLAVIVFPDERNLTVIILSLVAFAALILSRVRKHHLSLDKYSMSIFLGGFLFGAQNLFLKPLLEVYDPFTLYFVRVGLMGIILLSFVKLESNCIQHHKIRWAIASSVVVVIEFVAMYWAIKEVGIVTTTLFRMGSPLLVLWGSSILRHEKVNKKDIIATIVISACIAGALLA